MPAFRRGEPTGALGPTPHARPIASATSASSACPMVGSVTTAISAPVVARSRSMSDVMRAFAAASTTPARSVTYPSGCRGKSVSTPGDCAGITGTTAS